MLDTPQWALSNDPDAGRYRQTDEREPCIGAEALEVRACAASTAFCILDLLLLFCPKVRSLIIARLDVELALQTGLPTVFCSNAIVPSKGTSGESHIIQKQLPSTASSRLSHIMLSVISFASLLNGRESETRPKLDPLSYTEMLVWLLYRLLEIAPWSQPRSTLGRPYDDVAHLAMLAFMTTLLPKYTRDDSSHLLSDRLESAIQDLHVMSADNQDGGVLLLLWAFFISGVSFLKCGDHGSMILETCARLELHDWPAVRQQLSRFPWIYTLHDAPGKCLWENAQRSNTEISEDFLRLEA